MTQKHQEEVQMGAKVAAVTESLRLQRLLWHYYFREQTLPDEGKRKLKPVWRSLPATRTIEAIQREHGLADRWLQLQRSHLWRRREDELLVHVDMFHPMRIAEALVGPLLSEPDLRYAVLREIRSRYDRQLASTTPNLLHRLARATNEQTLGAGVASSDAPSGAYSRNVNYRSGFILPLLQALEEKDFTPAASENVMFFVEVCAAVGYLRPSIDADTVTLLTPHVDAEFLLSHLFGITTGIQGFDDLFGGGGMILSEDLGRTPSNKSGILGRTVLLQGESGTGKSMLSLQLAVEVARKGGMVWILSLEQPAEECLYALEVIQALPDDGSVAVATSTGGASRLLQSHTPGVGGIVILRGEKGSYDNLLSNLVVDAERMAKYPIRLIIVDPINSVIRQDDDPALLRGNTLAAIEKIKKLRTNICLIAEENSEFPDDLMFEKNIADVVIRLSVEEAHNYAQRYIEIRKCRLQREQRGRHPFVITPGEGISIYLSPAGFSNKIRSRSLQPGGQSVLFGVAALDRVLGEQAIYPGDVIVLQGPEGTYKTPLGLTFLLGNDSRSSYGEAFRTGSLWIMVRDNEATARRMLSGPMFRGESVTRIRLCSLPVGHVQPGFILQRIMDEIVKARSEKIRINRVLIDDVAHWERSCPFVAADETFADTLIELLQRHGITTLFTCSEREEWDKPLIQRALVDRADCLLQFDRVEVFGTQRVLVRVRDTRGMEHLRESFEIKTHQGRLDLDSTPSLLRVGSDGTITGVHLRLIMHAEVQAQLDYHSELRDAFRAVLSRNITLEPQSPYMGQALAMRSLSAVDELQILQIDEFEMLHMTGAGSGDLVLHRFTANSGGERSDFLPRLHNRVSRNEGSFFAVPYYANLSLLAYRTDIFPSGRPGTWQELSDRCSDWEAMPHDPEAVFFEFPRGSRENYNCLFIEILSSMLPPPVLPNQRCHLRAWLTSDAALQAAMILRTLCRRAYLRNPNGVTPDHSGLGYDLLDIRLDAQVWRMWYSTLSPLADALPIAERERITIAPLPGDVSVAGEWYLGIPAYSSAPEAGLELIRTMTSREAEMERLRRGIGLPTRTTYYREDDGDKSSQEAVGPVFDVSREMILRLFERSVRRSDFGCYQQLAGPLAHYLRQIIEIPDVRNRDIEKRVTAILRNFDRSIDFLNPPNGCSTCLYARGFP